eukprot:COSAG06_NODE_3092_length_5869_cov_9.963085_4_plen_252_part_00
MRRLKLNLIRSDLWPLVSKCAAVVRARLIVFSVVLLHVWARVLVMLECTYQYLHWQPSDEAAGVSCSDGVVALERVGCASAGGVATERVGDDGFLAARPSCLRSRHLLHSLGLGAPAGALALRTFDYSPLYHASATTMHNARPRCSAPGRIFVEVYRQLYSIRAREGQPHGSSLGNLHLNEAPTLRLSLNSLRSTAQPSLRRSAYRSPWRETAKKPTLAANHTNNARRAARRRLGKSRLRLAIPKGARVSD